MLELNQIYLGDLLEIIKDIPDKSISTILCDPPYGIFKNLKWDKTLNWELVWKEFNRIIKDNGAILIFCVGVFKYHLYNSNPKMYKYELIFQKSLAGNPFNAKYMPLQKHEYIMVFGKKTIKYNKQLIEGKPYSRSLTPIKNNNLGYGVKNVQIDNLGTREPSMLLSYKNNWKKQNQLYPCEKPVALMEWLLKSYSNENDLILDPTIGSFPTGIACLKTNRNFIGIDSNSEAIKIAQDRLNYFYNHTKDIHEK